MGFSHTGRSEQDHIGAAVKEVECQEMLELHAVKLGWPVPVPAGHGFDHGEAGVLDATLDTFDEEQLLVWKIRTRKCLKKIHRPNGRPKSIFKPAESDQFQI